MDNKIVERTNELKQEYDLQKKLCRFCKVNPSINKGVNLALVLLFIIVLRANLNITKFFFKLHQFFNKLIENGLHIPIVRWQDEILCRPCYVT